LGEDAVVAQAGRLEHAALEPFLAGRGVGVEHPVAVLVEQHAHLAPELDVGLLEPDVDLAAAREAHLECVGVGDPVVDLARGRAGEDLLRALGHVGLDAPAGDRADDASALGDHHLRAGLARRRAERRDDGPDRRLLAGRGRSVDRVEDLLHAPQDNRAVCSDGRIAPPRRARPAARIARRYASTAVSAPAITSPVERISGPRVAAPGKRSAGNTASFAQARVGTAFSARFSWLSRSPSSSRTECSTSGTPVALATNGTVRDARGFASRTKSLPVSRASWRLIRPRAPRPAAIRLATSRISTSSASETDGPGRTQAESPECT